MEEKSLPAREPGRAMDVNHPKFRSFGEFVRELGEIILLAGRERKALRAMNPRFRETISLAVSFANHCRV